MTKTDKKSVAASVDTAAAAPAAAAAAPAGAVHDQIVEQFNTYMDEHNKFEVKGVKASAARARKALGEMGKLSKARRAEIQDKKNAG